MPIPEGNREGRDARKTPFSKVSAGEFWPALHQWKQMAPGGVEQRQDLGPHEGSCLPLIWGKYSPFPIGSAWIRAVPLVAGNTRRKKLYRQETTLVVNLKQFFSTAMATRLCCTSCLKRMKLKSLNNHKKRCEKGHKKYPCCIIFLCRGVID